MPWRDAKHVALCGNPKSGKSTIAEMLVDEFGGVIIDDGLILRQALPILMGIDPALPFSQSGKASSYTIGTRTETVREGLGELGNYLEARYGQDFMPNRGMQMAAQDYPDAPFYIYPSCRKTQGLAYKRAGGVVIQVDNPLAPPSGKVFDLWDRSCVDFVIENDPDLISLDELRDYVCQLPNLVAELG